MRRKLDLEEKKLDLLYKEAETARDGVLGSSCF